jgi:DNA ligase (NAD+)
MIIPQISGNSTRSGNVKVPEQCPVCSYKTAVKQDNGVKSLYCTNEDCPAKHIKSYTHFVSRDAMGIDGLSEATIEKLITKGFIKELADIFRIDKYKDEIIRMEGFGEKSYYNLLASVNKSRKTSTSRLLYSLGIPNIGLSNAKIICKHFNYDWNLIQQSTFDELIQINGIGNVMAEAFVKYFSNEKNKIIVKDILEEIEFEDIKLEKADLLFENINFVITGSVEHFKNRSDLKAVIEERGGKVTSSVTTKTNYLINNDNLSNSSKNKKAKELGISIITEKQLMDWFNDVY